MTNLRQHNTSPAQGLDAVASAARPLIEVENLALFYGAAQALKGVSMGIHERLVTAFIGPSGCGKSTLLRCFNRMNDLIDNVRLTGSIRRLLERKVHDAVND